MSEKKGRGRPRKTGSNNNKTVNQVKSEDNSAHEEEEDLILHLEIYDEKSSETKDINIKSAIMKESVISSDEENDIFQKKDKTASESSEENYSHYLNELKKKDAIIKKLKTDLMNASNMSDKQPIGILKSSKMKIINNKLIYSDKSNRINICDKTDISCWWCAHNFETVPCFLPDRYLNDKYYVFGCFCTPSCVLAYNLNMNDYRMNIRMALIKKLYGNLYPKENIPVAPQRELLRKFGGDMTINEFRDDNMLLKKEFKVSMPPVIPLLLTVEEKPFNN